MNLRELLLQFAGENEEVLELDELLLSSVPGIEIEEDMSSGVRVLVECPTTLDAVKNRIIAVLERAGYEEYVVTPTSEGDIRHILVTVQ